ncbi:MAG: hypothetical protein ACXVKA_08275 [Acidimicrobiia bacterium]
MKLPSSISERPLPAILERGRTLTLLVLGATVAFHLLYVLPATRHLASWLLHEDNVVEDVSFVADFAAAVIGFRLALRTRRGGAPRWVWAFWMVFAAGMFLVAMEEISWGQWLFFWKTPDVLKHVNRQDETNLHNLGGLWGKSEWMRFTFVVGGIAGLIANRWRELRRIAVSPPLAGAFAVLAVWTIADLVNDFVHGPWIFTTFNPMSEWDEMLIGVLALAYFVVKRDQERSAEPSSAPTRPTSLPA